MFNKNRYAEKSKAELIQFMKNNPFAIIITQGEKYPVATHIPVEITANEGSIIITGHIARQTEHLSSFERNNNALVIFAGPHAYVSASWYTNTAMASTWNYMTVHAKGKLQLLNTEETYSIIKTLTERYEASSENSSTIEKMDEDYIRKSLKAIVGFKIKVEELESVFKLSQSQDKQSQQNIINELRRKGDDQSILIAKEMEKRLDVMPSA